jgi:hypothetical protein
MNSSILVDTGPLVAILSPKDDYHQICINTLKSLKGCASDKCGIDNQVIPSPLFLS